MPRTPTDSSPDADAPDTSTPTWSHRQDATPWYETFPWWIVMIGAVLGWFGYLIIFDAGYNIAWDRIAPGLSKTITTTLYSFALACIVGLAFGLMRTSRFFPLRNIARTYVEFVRGIPILVLIFTMSLVVVPDLSRRLGIDTPSQTWRAVIALATIYSAYISEIVRAGIESVDRGQVEAGRAVGMTRGQTSRYIVLPQALRSVIPPLGNDFVAILKDTSLLSVLGVLDVTQRARQYGGATFRYGDTYLVLVFIYVSLTVVLSLFVQWVETRMNQDRQGAR